MLEPGYLVFENIVSEAECSLISSTIQEHNGRIGAGVRNLMSLDEVSRLAHSDCLQEICEKAVGKRLVPFKATLFNKSGKANWLVSWHQDTALPVETAPIRKDWGEAKPKQGVLFAHAPTSALRRILALRIHLDASNEHNGPLRVISNSHKTRILIDEEFRRIVDKGTQIELKVGLGGVIAMSPLLIHASSKCLNDEPRRVLHIEYTENLEIEPGLLIAKA